MVDLNIILPDGFLAEEIRCEYKISNSIKQLWAVELDLLNELDQICKKHNLHYWADSGTLLGAIRHNGFIPWDDDIDVFMFREEYEKLCELASEFKSPYFFQTEETDPFSLRGHAQLRNSETTGILLDELDLKIPFNQGVFIDIFPLDYVPDDDSTCDSFLKKINTYSWWIKSVKSITVNYRHQTSVKGLIKSILHYLSKPLGIRLLLNLYYKREKLMTSYKGTNRVMELFFYPTKITPQIDCSYFKNTVTVPFEFMSIPVPEEYEKILNLKYSNWHEFKRGGAYHSGLIYDVDQSYIDYKNSN